MGTSISIESHTWFDRLPTEIIFTIFDYLSSNDIIYTFFYFSQRFNNLLLKNQRYLNYFEFPTTNLNRWKNILSIIGSRIECLNISTIDSSSSLRYFQNLKYIIISTFVSLSDKQIELIFESNQFKTLHTLKIKYYPILYTKIILLIKILN